MSSTATVQNSNFCPPKSTYAGKRKKKKKQRKRSDQNVDAGNVGSKRPHSTKKKAKNLNKLKQINKSQTHSKVPFGSSLFK